MALVYSCCFWFSLRLGGILIAIFSSIQALAMLICYSVAYCHEQSIREHTARLIDSFNLLYMKPYVDNFHADPKKYLLIGIIFFSIYIMLCLCYAYGAYKFNNILMIGYLLVELFRVIFLLFAVTTWLLLFKENTMDLGIHIGASVVGSFLLLGMTYLWICAANLPILINEMERDQQKATIHKLQKMLEINYIKSNRRSKNAGELPLGIDYNLHPYHTPVTLTTNLQRNVTFKQIYDNVPQHTRPF